MAGLKESMEELRAAWEAVPPDRRAAAAEQATAAALIAGDALRILKSDLPTLAAPAVNAGTKAALGHFMWRLPLHEIFDVVEAVFPELVKILKQVAHQLGFEEEKPPTTPPASP